MRRLPFLITLSLMFLSTVLVGDIVYLTDGSKREGTVVEETEAEVVLEMTIGGIKAALRIPLGKVLRIEKKKTESELLKEEFARRKKTLQAGDLDAMESLAHWCAASELYTEATGLYQEMSNTGQVGLKRGQLALSKMEFERGKLEAAIQVVEELNKELPDNEEVLKWLEHLRQVRREDLAASLERAMDHRKNGRPERALKSLQLLLERVGADETKEAFAGMALPGNPDLFETMAALRLARKCPLCKDGKLTCKACDGSGEIDRERLCTTCNGTGYVLCSGCDGTGILWDGVARDERPAVVALLSKMQRDESEILAELNRKLAKPNVTIADVRDIVSEAIYRAGRVRAFSNWALPLTSEVDLIRTFKTNRLESEGLVGRTLLKSAGKFETAAVSQLKEIEESGESLLKHDEDLHTAHRLLEQAVSYCTSVNVEAVTVEIPPKKVTQRLKEMMQKAEQVLERNARVRLLYETAMKLAQADRFQEALPALEELVTKAPRADVDYLSGEHKKRSPETLPEFMAKCRFESGKDNRDGFGEPTDYEKGAFVKLLLSEAGAKAGEARERYQSLLDARARGRGPYIHSQRIKTTQELAEDARDWYQALLTIKYPLRAETVRQVEETIEEMKHIISKCKRWYTPGQPTPGTP